ncbi:hypothetical protein SBP02_11890 [Pseudomonas benzenivorans]|uniref:Self-protective colicin-like immunity n=1 Tax=Pseudomonas benzenivorans TaxID=556533 RepID=A0ABZ0PRH3_9PSED|nr:hypothetical protein [Pseudomonas benzenivorans]WPC03486.1 hypothetical protein SBP02_11890 [Pseudomonas benzenivorans]
MKKFSERHWRKTIESCDFTMYVFQRANDLKVGGFPEYFAVVLDAYLIEFGMVEHDFNSQEQLEIDEMLEALSAKYLEDPSKAHLASVMRLKLERDMGV